MKRAKASAEQQIDVLFVVASLRPKTIQYNCEEGEVQCLRQNAQETDQRPGTAGRATCNYAASNTLAGFKG